MISFSLKVQKSSFWAMSDILGIFLKILVFPQKCTLSLLRPYGLLPSRNVCKNTEWIPRKKCHKRTDRWTRRLSWILRTLSINQGSRKLTKINKPAFTPPIIHNLCDAFYLFNQNVLIIHSWDTVNFIIYWLPWTHPFLTIPTLKMLK